tara:strand:+ start:536 stop:1006 length:471 start_codon:yes stop_codon:yes gene_type:complete
MVSRLKKLKKSQNFSRYDFAGLLFTEGLDIKQVKEITCLPHSRLVEIRTGIGLPSESENIITREEMEKYFEMGLSTVDISRATDIPYRKVLEASKQYGLSKFKTVMHPEEIVKVAKLFKEGYNKKDIAKNMNMTVRQIDFMEPYINDLSSILESKN